MATDWTLVDAILRQRAGNRCERPDCRRPEHEAGLGRFHRHHVRPKGAGGTSEVDCDDPAKLKLLHARCHSWAHSHPREARAMGLLESRLGTVRPSALVGGVSG